MKKMWAIVSVAVVFVSLISCTKKEVAVEKEIISAKIRTPEPVQSADKAEIVRLRGLLDAAGKEFVSLRENADTLTQANKGLVAELLAMKDALKTKEAEIGILSRDLKRALEIGGKTKRSLIAKIVGLNKERSEIIALQTSLSDKLRAAEENEKKLIDELATQKAFHANAIKEWGERLNKKDKELTAAQENVFWKKMALLVLALFFLIFGAIFFLRAKINKLQPVTQ